MKTCYLAGPMTGYEDYNFPAFINTAEKLRAGGFTVISPAEMDINAGVNYKDKAGTKLSPAEIRVLVKRDIDAILTLRAEEDDFIAMLPGWEKSRGCGSETYTGRWAGLKLKQVVEHPGGILVLVPIALAQQVTFSVDASYPMTIIRPGQTAE